MFRPGPQNGGRSISFVVCMSCFEAPNRASINAFHEAALSAGGKDEGAAGTRSWAENAYAAYARDLDGNKLAAYSFKAE